MTAAETSGKPTTDDGVYDPGLYPDFGGDGPAYLTDEVVRAHGGSGRPWLPASHYNDLYRRAYRLTAERDRLRAQLGSTGEARDIRSLLHLAGIYATRAVAATEAMEVAFNKMRARCSSGEIDDVDGVHATDWAARVKALAAASHACSALAAARSGVDAAERAGDAHTRSGDALDGVAGYVAHPPGTDPTIFKPEDVTVVRAGHTQPEPRRVVATLTQFPGGPVTVDAWIRTVRIAASGVQHVHWYPDGPDSDRRRYVGVAADVGGPGDAWDAWDAWEPHAWDALVHDDPDAAPWDQFDTLDTAAACLVALAQRADATKQAIVAAHGEAEQADGEVRS